MPDIRNSPENPGGSPFRPAGDDARGALRSWGLVRMWFGLSSEVRPFDYATTGLALMLLKYSVEASLVFQLAGRFFSPWQFLNPLLSMRQQFFGPPAPNWLQWAVFAWTLPFLWIMVSMSVRRAVGAGRSAWLGLMVLVPFVNYVFMLLLCVLPQRAGVRWPTRPQPVVDARIKSALVGILAGLAISLAMVGLSVYALHDYGAVLFFGTPVIVGAASAYLYNRPYPRSLRGSLLVAETAIALAGLALLLFAFEGIICLAMLMPLACAMGLLGGLIGHAVGTMTASRVSTLALVVAALPALAGAEHLHRPTPLFEVLTTVEIAAAPEAVWPHVVGFSDLPEPDPWYFKLGIAYPKRATISGTGVGAVRRCEFSTGAFMEPITAWEPGVRLAFDVASQPPPMHELSPYRHVHPPHLDGYLRCRKGEFRLVPLDGGRRTRLEGSTWYEFEMYPQDYWTLWSDAAIHRIHGRVLEHIKWLAEGKNHEVN